MRLRRKTEVQADLHRASQHEAATLQSAIEVAAVKAQVQAIVRRLHNTLDELEAEIDLLPDNGGTEAGGDGGVDAHSPPEGGDD